MFLDFAKWISRNIGHPATFASACFIILLWSFSGVIFEFSNTWQLIINTFTTIFTFLSVILLQHSQNHDTLSLQLKLDEIIKNLPTTDKTFLNLEELTLEELDIIKERHSQLADKVSAVIESKKSSTL